MNDDLLSGGPMTDGLASLSPESFHDGRIALMARSVVFIGKQADIALSEIGLSDAQYRMLALLRRGTFSSSTAANLLGVSPPSITSISEGMIQRSLINRSPAAADRRRVELSITDFGLETLRKGDEAVSSRLMMIADYASDQDRRELSMDALVWWAEAIRRGVAATSL
jgi:DNA-binding MarR family transcriptional regulator